MKYGESRIHSVASAECIGESPSSVHPFLRKLHVPQECHFLQNPARKLHVFLVLKMLVQLVKNLRCKMSQSGTGLVHVGLELLGYDALRKGMEGDNNDGKWKEMAVG